MKKILIIGKNGFVARNLTEYLSNNCKYEVTNAGSSSLNLFDEEQIKRFLSNCYFDIVIDCAVWSPGNADIIEAAKEVENDLRLFFNIAKYSDMYGKLIHFGSGAEFGKNQPIVDVKETSFGERVPMNSYGFAKYVINSFIEKSDNLYSLRIFGLFGKYEEYQTTFISGACAKAVFGIPISIRKNVYFDYLYITDFCKMVESFIEIEEPKYHSYNIVSGKKIDLISLANIVRKVAKKLDEKDINLFVCDQGLANEYTASNERLLKEIGEFSFTEYEEAIEELYNYYKDNIDNIDMRALLYQ